jgi:hypothetical protein
VDGPGAPARDARKVRAAKVAAGAVLLLAGFFLFPGPASMVAFAGLAVLGWGRAAGMIGLFLFATSLAAHATRKPPPPVDDLSPILGPTGPIEPRTPSTPPPGAGG